MVRRLKAALCRLVLGAAGWAGRVRMGVVRAAISSHISTNPYRYTRPIVHIVDSAISLTRTFTFSGVLALDFNHVSILCVEISASPKPTKKGLSLVFRNLTIAF